MEKSRNFKKMDFQVLEKYWDFDNPQTFMTVLEPNLLSLRKSNVEFEKKKRQKKTEKGQKKKDHFEREKRAKERQKRTKRR